jgi:ATP-dependent Clp protease ATP-binding subunit ClpC
MFERYTESAKRVIFFGRYEASQYGSPEIKTEHLLLGLFRGDRRLARKILGSGGPIKRFTSSSSSIESIRRNIRVVGGKISTSDDIPLSNESKRVLEYAAEEADRIADRHVRSKHLLLGLLREDQSLAAQLLNGEGVTLEQARAKV